MPEKLKVKKPRVSKDAENLQCHVHDEVGIGVIRDIRQNVCVNDLPLTEHADGQHYYLFHLPTRDKDITKFKEIFRARLESVNQKVDGTEELSEEEREEAKRKLFYDFRYVWFPLEVYLENYQFQAETNFSSTTFSSGANFGEASFSSGANFGEASFSAITNFTRASFSGALLSLRQAFRGTLISL